MKIPHNNELEREYIGAIMLETENENIRSMLAMINPDDFFNNFHKKIIKEMRELADNGDICDISTLSGRLGQDTIKDISMIENCAGLAFKANLMANELRTYNVRRKAMMEGERLSNIASGAKSIEEVTGAISKASEYIDNTIGEIKEFTTLDTIKETAKQVLNTTKGDSPRVLFNLSFVDFEMQMFRKQIHTLGAFQGAGKTAMALTMFQSQLRNQKKVAYFCSESSRHEILMRIKSMLMGVPVSDLINGSTNKEQFYGEYQRVTKILHARAENFWIYGLGDLKPMSMDAVELQVRKITRQVGRLDTIYLDFLQDFDRGDERIPQNERIGNIVQHFKRIVVDSDSAGIMLSQFNRVTHDKGRPTKASFRGSGVIDDVSHLMSVLYRQGEDSAKYQKGIMYPTEWYSVKTRLVRPWSREIYFDTNNGEYRGDMGNDRRDQ